MTFTYTHVTCSHPPDKVWADLLHGELVPHGGQLGGKQVQWCSVCGAHRFVFGNPFAGETLRYGDWSEPALRRITGEGVRA